MSSRLKKKLHADSDTFVFDYYPRRKETRPVDTPNPKERTAGCKEFETLIANLDLMPLFQPVLNFREEAIIGYEALVRGPKNSPIHQPEALFAEARACGLQSRLDLLCCETAITAFDSQELPGLLFLNICNETLDSPRFLDQLLNILARTRGLAPENLVLKIGCLPNSIDDSSLQFFRRAREKGLAFSLGNWTGAGAGLDGYMKLVPEYVKLGGNIIRGIDTDRSKWQVAKSLRDIANSFGSQIIAETIETQDECFKLQNLGIPCGQGFFLGQPLHQPPRAIPTEIYKKEVATGVITYRWRSESVASLIRRVPKITSSTPLDQTIEIFQKHLELWSIPVVDQGHPLGIVRRDTIMNILANPYGRDLFGRESILQFTDRTPMIIDRDTPVEKLSELITGQTGLHWREDFIITGNDLYLGMGTINDLLGKMTELQLRNARHANPLTLLPGNVPIQERIEQMLLERSPFTVCYCDLDNFKPYNDFFGYSRGDGVLRLLADILVQHADPVRDFVGHIGGDDFIVVFESENWRCRCEGILDSFSRKIPETYDEEQRKQGGINGLNREGAPTFLPIISLSIAAVPVLDKTGLTHYEVAALASAAKKKAKKISGNILYLDEDQAYFP